MAFNEANTDKAMGQYNRPSTAPNTWIEHGGYWILLRLCSNALVCRWFCAVECHVRSDHTSLGCSLEMPLIVPSQCSFEW